MKSTSTAIQSQHTCSFIGIKAKI